MTDKPLLMLSMPNSGSTWFALLLAEFLPGHRYYDKEFFNPVCNMKHERVLRRNFGSELASCYRNICSPGDARIGADIEATWGKENYTFTKECMSPFKLDAFLPYFGVFLFLRTAANTFPPKRVRVWSFYEHMWHSLRDHDWPVTATALDARCWEAHHIIQCVMIDTAVARGVPVLWWEDLFGPANTMAPVLAQTVGWASDDLIRAIVERRQATERG